MKIFSLAFSARQSGNCSKVLQYCLSQPPLRQMEQDHCSAFDLTITPCQGCNYECFLESGSCPLIDTDDVALLYRKWAQSDLTLCAIPVYSGNLAAQYFAFWERGQAFFKNSQSYHDLLRKVHFLIIGNLSAGGDMALHQALYPYANLNFWPETLIFSSHEYGRKSISGDLIESAEVRGKLDAWVGRIATRIKL